MALQEFMADLKAKGKKQFYILKPDAGCQGKGIRLVQVGFSRQCLGPGSGHLKAEGNKQFYISNRMQAARVRAPAWCSQGSGPAGRVQGRQLGFRASPWCLVQGQRVAGKCKCVCMSYGILACVCGAYGVVCDCLL